MKLLCARSPRNGGVAARVVRAHRRRVDWRCARRRRADGGDLSVATGRASLAFGASMRALAELHGTLWDAIQAHVDRQRRVWVLRAGWCVPNRRHVDVQYNEFTGDLTLRIVGRRSRSAVDVDVALVRAVPRLLDATTLYAAARDAFGRPLCVTWRTRGRCREASYLTLTFSERSRRAALVTVALTAFPPDDVRFGAVRQQPGWITTMVHPTAHDQIYRRLSAWLFCAIVAPRPMPQLADAVGQFAASYAAFVAGGTGAYPDNASYGKVWFSWLGAADRWTCTHACQL